MRIVHQKDINIIDMGDMLVIVPIGLSPELDGDFGGYDAVPCGGYEPFTTKAGRLAARVLPGRGYTLRIADCGGDRSWSNWDNRRPFSSEHGDVFAYAVATSRGGGCWFEVTIVPDGGYDTAYQARLRDELAT